MSEEIVTVHGIPVNDSNGGEVVLAKGGPMSLQQVADHCNEVQRRRYCPRDQRTQQHADEALAKARNCNEIGETLMGKTKPCELPKGHKDWWHRHGDLCWHGRSSTSLKQAEKLGRAIGDGDKR